MKTINRILFPTDFSETAKNAFRYCLSVADAYEANIQLLHVVYPEYQVMDVPVMAMQATQDKVEAAKTLLQSFVDLALVQVQAGGPLRYVPAIKSDVEVGDPVSVITKIAQRDSADMIIMGTRGEHNALDRFFGSVTTGVVERAHCSVWVIPEQAIYNSIDIAAYATDLKDADPYHIWKASQLLDPFHPILHCVHVSSNGQNGQMNMNDIELFFATNAPALQINFHQLQGKSVTESLEEFTDTHDVDVLVMYAPHHTFLERLFSPSQTKQMTLRTHIPLLLYKAE
ncbi:MAG: universal stress protein [Saprospiraceae bacterium]